MPIITVETDVELYDYIVEFTDEELQRELDKRQKARTTDDKTRAARDELRRELAEAFVNNDRRHFQVLLLRVNS